MCLNTIVRNQYMVANFIYLHFLLTSQVQIELAIYINLATYIAKFALWEVKSASFEAPSVSEIRKLKAAVQAK